MWYNREKASSGSKENRARQRVGRTSARQDQDEAVNAAQARAASNDIYNYKHVLSSNHAVPYVQASQRLLVLVVHSRIASSLRGSGRREKVLTREILPVVALLNQEKSVKWARFM